MQSSVNTKNRSSTSTMVSIQRANSNLKYFCQGFSLFYPEIRSVCNISWFPTAVLLIDTWKTKEAINTIVNIRESRSKFFFYICLWSVRQRCTHVYGYLESTKNVNIMIWTTDSNRLKKEIPSFWQKSVLRISILAPAMPFLAPGCGLFCQKSLLYVPNLINRINWMWQMMKPGLIGEGLENMAGQVGKAFWKTGVQGREGTSADIWSF